MGLTSLYPLWEGLFGPLMSNRVPKSLPSGPDGRPDLGPSSPNTFKSTLGPSLVVTLLPTPSLANQSRIRLRTRISAGETSTLLFVVRVYVSSPDTGLKTMVLRLL